MKGPLYRIPVGSHILLDGRSWNVVAVCDGDLDVSSDDRIESTTLSFTRVEKAIREGKCEVTSPAEIEKRRALLDFTGGYEHVDQLPKDERSAVSDRFLLVRAMQEIEAKGHKLTHRNLEQTDVLAALRGEARRLLQQEDNVSEIRARNRVAKIVIPQGRTLKKYFELYFRFDRNPVVLMHREHMKGPQGEKRGKLDIWQEQFLRYALEHWLRPVKVKLAPLFRQAQDAYRMTAEPGQIPFTFPSITTMRNRVKAMSRTQTAIAREGLRQATNLKAAGVTDVRAIMFGERVEIDGVLLSVFVDKSGKRAAKLRKPREVPEKLEDGEILRVWLHVAIDIATKMVIAWVMSENLNADYTLALLRMASRDKTREAERYECNHAPAPAVRLSLQVADNGTETRNATVRGAQLGLGGTVSDARVYHASDKPGIESVFGPIQWDVLNFLDGYLGSRPGELPGYDPKAATSMSPDFLYGILTRYFIDEYPFREHKGTGMGRATPMQKLEQVLGDYPVLEAPKLSERRLHLGMKKKVTVNSEGIRFGPIPYHSAKLVKWADTSPDRVVTAHLDPDFPAQVTVTIEGSTLQFIADLSMTDLADLTYLEMLEVIEETATQNPEKQQLHAEHLRAARQRRVMASGYFKPANKPETWTLLETLEKQSDRLLGIEVVPPRETIRRSSFMDRSSNSQAVPTRHADDNAPPPSSSPAPKNSDSRKFNRITKSKL